MTTTLQSHGGGAQPASIDASGKVTGGTALRVYGFDTPEAAHAAGYVCEGGPAMSVALITDAQLASGTWKAEGDPSATVIYTAPSGTPVEGGYAVPVYAVNGWGSTPAPIPDPIGDTLRADAKLSVQYTGGAWVDPSPSGHIWGGTNAPTATSTAYGNAVTLDSTQALSTPADTPDLSPGNHDFTLVAAVKATQFPADVEPMFIAIKDNAVADDEYYIVIEGLAVYNRVFGFLLGDQGNYVEVLSSSFGSAVLNTLYLVFAWYDAALQSINIQINNGTVDSFVCPVPNTVFAGPSTLDIGADTAAGTSFIYPFHGQIVFSYFDRKLTQTEKDYLYNSGAGRALFPAP